MADLLGPNGEVINADSIRARLSADTQRAIDEKMREWQDSELGAYDLEDVLELGHHII